MLHHDESLLLKRAAAGHTEAFRVLFERHREAVYRFAWHLSGNSGSAEDVTQECFLRLVRHPQRFDAGRGSLRQYLYGMVRNLVRQHRDAAARELPLEEEGEPALPARPPAWSETADVARAVHAAVTELPALQREALALFEFEGLSLEETAAVVGADVGTVKSRLYRARERLRRALAPYGKEKQAPRSLP